MLAIRETLPAIATVGSDTQLIELWLHGKSSNTRDAYQRDINYFLAFLNGKPLQNVTLNDVQAYDTTLREHRSPKNGKQLSPATVNRRMAAVKSLLKYGHQLGVLAVNAALPFKVKKGTEHLSERILTQRQVERMIEDFQGSDRDCLILRFLYFSGCRVSEVCSLTWTQCRTLDDGKGELTIHGKGSKTRTILIKADEWVRIAALRQGRDLSAPVFASRTGKHLTRVQINRIVATAAKKADIGKNVSPHWLRHAHASHALKRKAPLNLVQRSLGHANLNTTALYLHASPDESSGLHLELDL